MSGGASPPRKEAADKKKFLDGINDPHGELRAWECPAAVEEREEAKRGKVSMNITSPHGYRTKQIQITQKYPKDGAEREHHPHAWPVELAVTWAPLEGSDGNDMVSTLEIDPKELKEGGSLTWTGEAAEDKARTAENRDDSRQSSSVEPEKPTNKRARKGDMEARTKTSEEIDWDDHLKNQEMDLRYYQNKIEEIRNQRNGIPKYRVGDKVRLGDAEMIIEEIIRAGDMRNTRKDGMLMYLIRSESHSPGRFFVCLASEDEIKPRRKKEKKGQEAACLMAPTRRDEDPDYPGPNSLHDLSLVGIDTCSAVSVSTEPEDFLFIDRSDDAKDSVTLRSVGGMNSAIGERTNGGQGPGQRWR
jgi:hypothetical protein